MNIAHNECNNGNVFFQIKKSIHTLKVIFFLVKYHFRLMELWWLNDRFWSYWLSSKGEREKNNLTISTSIDINRIRLMDFYFKMKEKRIEIGQKKLFLWFKSNMRKLNFKIWKIFMEMRKKSKTTIDCTSNISNFGYYHYERKIQNSVPRKDRKWSSSSSAKQRIGPI